MVIKSNVLPTLYLRQMFLTTILLGFRIFGSVHSNPINFPHLIRFEFASFNAQITFSDNKIVYTLIVIGFVHQAKSIFRSQHIPNFMYFGKLNDMLVSVTLKESWVSLWLEPVFVDCLKQRKIKEGLGYPISVFKLFHSHFAIFN